MNEPKSYQIVLSDIWVIAKRKWKLITLSALLLGSFSLYQALDREVLYLAEGSFRDKGKADAGMRQSMSDIIFGSNGDKIDSEAVSSMKSSRLMASLINKMHLQASISEKSVSFSFFDRAYRHILSEYAFWTRRKVPILEDLSYPIVAENVNYEGEVPLHVEVTFITDSDFKLDSGEVGELGKPVMTFQAEFTLMPKDLQPLKGRKFDIVFKSLPQTAKTLSQQIFASQDQDDRSLIKLKYYDVDRRRAALFVNDLMSAYQDFLEEEHDRISLKQLDYLKKREQEMAHSLKEVMEAHAAVVSEDLTASGFTNTQKELEFLTQQMLQANQKEMEIELEKKRLEHVLTGEYAAFDPYSPAMADAHVINEMLQKMRALKLGQDSLELALNEDTNFTSDNFTAELKTKETLKKCCRDADEILTALETNKPLDSNLSIIKEPKYLISAWNDKLNEKKKDKGLKEQFKSYVAHLKRLLDLQISSIDERLQHRSQKSRDFQGITLDMAQGIYLQLTKDRQEVENQTRQFAFVLEQIEEPSFEISSLSSLMSDPISMERINKGAQITLALKDQSNRSTREIERLTEELQLQKDFLKMHIKESQKLLVLKAKLLEEKDNELKRAMLDMSHHELTLLEKQLTDYISTRLVNLDNERGMIQTHQEAIKNKMASIPEKWIKEQLLEQHLIRNQKMVENITGMVESKNISNNLELIQSAPLDFAIVPIFPKNPHLIIWTIIGLFGGAFISFLFFVSKGILSSTPLTAENLTLNNHKVLGELTYKRKDKTAPAYDTNLDTLRRISDLLTPEMETLALFPGKGIQFADLLLDILKRQGKKVLLINFSQTSDLTLQGLNPSSIKGNIITVQPDRYSYETITSIGFDKTLHDLKSLYDYILWNSPDPINSATGHAILRRFDISIIGVLEETADEWENELSWLEGKKAYFVINRKL